MPADSVTIATAIEMPADSLSRGQPHQPLEWSTPWPRTGADVDACVHLDSTVL